MEMYVDFYFRIRLSNFPFVCFLGYEKQPNVLFFPPCKSQKNDLYGGGLDQGSQFPCLYLDR